ncbi:MAG: hypothetical protein ACYTFA_02130 [Planctomycetota bacterium]|jgi:hypothetical protein
MASEPVLIRRTNTVEEADIIVAWLEEQGVKATVPDRDNPGVLAFGLTDVEGIEIYAADAETAERARTLLVQHDKERDAESEAATPTELIEVTCEECGQVNSFASDAIGSVQECCECGGYLDMPGADVAEGEK